MDETQNTPEPQRRRLGRGLNALLGTSSLPEDGVNVKSDQSEISVELIEPNPFQSRKDFEQGALNELIDSVRRHGILQPIIVRQVGDTYQLIAGERRLIAAKRAGLESVPCRVLELSDQQVYEVSLEENLKRQDLNVLEKAVAFQEYLQRFECTIEELSQRLSLDRSTVSNLIRLLDLAEPVKELVRSNQITGGHAKAILTLPTESQVALAHQIVKEGLSVRKTEEAARELMKSIEAGDPATVPFEKPAKSAPELSNHLLSLQDQLMGMFGAKVSIKLKGKAKDKGNITIEFQSNDDFERILGHLRRVA